MRRKQVLSLFMLVMGVALLVTAMAVGGASSATKKPGSAEALKGGTLKLNENSEDFDYVDPGLAYRTDDWAMLYTVNLMLVNFPEKAGPAGAQLYPEAATSFPTVSRDGKTYTFHLRAGLKFSNGQAVTAAAYQRAWERNLSPKMGSPLGVNDQFQNVIVGAQAFLDGKASTISGISAKGLTLTFHLTKPNPTFVSYLSMQWFGAIPPSTPYTSSGLNTFSSAGPYYIASRTPGRSTVLKRNPYYKGSRPANPDEIVFTPNVDVDQSLLQVKAGQADMDIGGIPPSDAGSLGTPNAAGSQYKVGPTSCIDYMAMNTAKAPFSSVALRQAVNWGIDRPAQLRLLGKYAGKRSDQILVPGIPGYKPYNVYAIAGANVAKAKQVGGSAIGTAGKINVIHSNSASSTNRAQVVEYNLKQMGFDVNDDSVPGTTYYQNIQTKGTSYDLAMNGGWCADYFDPFDYINVLFDGRTIQQTNNVDWSFFNNAAFNKDMDHAASLSGQARSAAYAKLDYELMSKYAPVVPYVIANNRYYIAKRVKNWIYSSYFGEPYFNALSVG